MQQYLKTVGNGQRTMRDFTLILYTASGVVSIAAGIRIAGVVRSRGAQRANY
jgi:hypothetical protein